MERIDEDELPPLDMMRLRPFYSVEFYSSLLQNLRERLHRLRKQIRTGNAPRRPAAKEMRFERREADVAGLRHVRHYLGNPPLSLASNHALRLAMDPILDVEMDGERLGYLPAGPRIE